MKSILITVSVLLVLLPATASLAANNGLIAWWTFDQGNNGYDCVGKIDDTINGHLKFIDGVAGKSLKFDEFTTFIKRPADRVPSINTESFTIEAWVALRSYPWNWCPIVMQKEDDKGFYFALDADGRFGLHVAVDGSWKRCNTASSLPGLKETDIAQTLTPKPKGKAKPVIPLLKWSHLVGTFDAEKGIALYLNGQAAGRLAVKGEMTPASKTDLYIGRNAEKTLPAHIERPNATFPFHFSLDGLVDEIKMYNHALDADEVQAAYQLVQPKIRKPLEFRRIPTGPKGPGRFGAYTTRLHYDEDWERTRRMGKYSDIVVRFDEFPFKLIYWNGLSYYPTWWTENDIGICHEGPETWKDATGYCYEAMMDRQCRYSHVRILENTDARVKILWRFSCGDMHYDLTNIDPVTGWPDWSEDIYTIYPDGVAARAVTLWTTNLPGNHSFEQENYIIQPGMLPEDILHTDAITLANIDGQEFRYTWEKYPPAAVGKKVLPEQLIKSSVNDGRVYFSSVDGIKDPTIQWYNFKAKSKPFMIVQPGACRFGLISPFNEWPWCFYRWNHFPIAQLPSDGRQVFGIDGRPLSSCVTQTAFNKTDPHNVLTDQSLTMFFLFGMTMDKSAGQLAPLARSWTQPAEMKVSSEGLKGQGYSVAERCYMIERRQHDRGEICAIEIVASNESPIANLAFVIKNWGDANAALKINGKEIERGNDFRYGHRYRLDETDLIVWLKMEATSPANFILQPAAK